MKFSFLKNTELKAMTFSHLLLKLERMGKIGLFGEPTESVARFAG